MIRRSSSDLSLLFDAHAAAQAVGALVGEALADAPLAPSGYALYSVLFDEGPQAPSALARRLGMPLTSMTHAVKALESRKHAARVPDPADGRSYRLQLTAEGLAAHAATSRAFAEAERRFRERLAVPRDQARRVLHAVLDAALDAQSDLRAERSA